MTVLVQAVDRKFYMDPRWVSSGFELQVSEDDDPEVITLGRVSKANIAAMLLVYGIRAEVHREGMKEMRLFGGEYVETRSHYVELLDMMPIPVEHKGCTDVPSGKWYGWELEFDVTSLYSGEPDLFLLSWLLGVPSYTVGLKSRCAEARALLPVDVGETVFLRKGVNYGT